MRRWAGARGPQKDLQLELFKNNDDACKRSGMFCPFKRHTPAQKTYIPIRQHIVVPPCRICPGRKQEHNPLCPAAPEFFHRFLEPLRYGLSIGRITPAYAEPGHRKPVLLRRVECRTLGIMRKGAHIKIKWALLLIPMMKQSPRGRPILPLTGEENIISRFCTHDVSLKKAVMRRWAGARGPQDFYEGYSNTTMALGSGSTSSLPSSSTRPR